MSQFLRPFIFLVFLLVFVTIVWDVLLRAVSLMPENTRVNWFDYRTSRRRRLIYLVLHEVMYLAFLSLFLFAAYAAREQSGSLYGWIGVAVVVAGICLNAALMHTAMVGWFMSDMSHRIRGRVELFILSYAAIFIPILMLSRMH